MAEGMGGREEARRKKGRGNGLEIRLKCVQTPVLQKRGREREREREMERQKERQRDQLPPSRAGQRLQGSGVPWL
jgi:hypothetical protein